LAWIPIGGVSVGGQVDPARKSALERVEGLVLDERDYLSFAVVGRCITDSPDTLADRVEHAGAVVLAGGRLQVRRADQRTDVDRAGGRSGGRGGGRCRRGGGCRGRRRCGASRTGRRCRRYDGGRGGRARAA